MRRALMNDLSAKRLIRQDRLIVHGRNGAGQHRIRPKRHGTRIAALIGERGIDGRGLRRASRKRHEPRLLAGIIKVSWLIGSRAQPQTGRAISQPAPTVAAIANPPNASHRARRGRLRLRRGRRGGFGLLGRGKRGFGDQFCRMEHAQCPHNWGRAEERESTRRPPWAAWCPKRRTGEAFSAKRSRR